MRNYLFALAVLFTLLAGSADTAHAQNAPSGCKSDAEGYCLLAPIPLQGADGGVTEKANINTYIKAMFQLAIGIAGGLAVLRIVMGGIKYMTSEAFGDKSDAKDTIYHAVIGLLLAISAYTILYTVNPRLVSFDFSIAGLKFGPAITTEGASETISCADGSVAPDRDVTKCPAGPTGGTVSPIAPDSPSLVGCFDCARIPSNVTYKQASQGGCKLPGPCVVNKEVGQKLSRFADLLDSAGISYQVTESYPPTIQHAATCQQVGKPDSGTCVDMALRMSPPTMQAINRACELGQSVGLRLDYEVQSQSRYVELQQRGVSKCRMLVIPRISGEHFSVYNR
jgi:hypothetical protein